MRPLHVLAFLLPLVVAYEAGSIRYLTDPRSGVAETIRARAILAGFFQAFGAVGLFLPGAALVTVLAIQHVMRRDPPSVRPTVLAGMMIESAAWTAPLFVFALLVQHFRGAAGVSAALAGPDGLAALPAASRLVLAIGAGLYEELLFRMIGIAALHALFVDVCRAREGTGRILAVAFSALAFAVYHDLSAPGAWVDWPRAFFYFCSGAYFGALYLWRGFGVTVGVHALYDVLVLVILNR
jgi:membrane protease YdiL (CAAX protease family)